MSASATQYNLDEDLLAEFIGIVQRNADKLNATNTLPHGLDARTFTKIVLLVTADNNVMLTQGLIRFVKKLNARIAAAPRQ